MLKATSLLIGAVLLAACPSAKPVSDTSPGTPEHEGIGGTGSTSEPANSTGDMKPVPDAGVPLHDFQCVGDQCSIKPQ